MLNIEKLQEMHGEVEMIIMELDRDIANRCEEEGASDNWIALSDALGKCIEEMCWDEIRDDGQANDPYPVDDDEDDEYEDLGPYGGAFRDDLDYARFVGLDVY